MNDIAKKLGIGPIVSFDDGNGIMVCNVKPVRKVEQQNNELLDALIEDTLSTADFLESMPNITFMDESIAKHISRIELAEKITKMPWDKIKELYP